MTCICGVHPESDLAMGESGRPVEVCRQGHEGEGLEKHQPVSDNLTAEYGSEGVLQHHLLD